MKQKLLAGALSLVLAVTFLAGCGSNQEQNSSSLPTSSPSSSQTAEKTAVNLGVISGPSGVGAVNLMQENEDEKAANDYTVSVASSPEEVVGKIASGELDLAAVPTNVACSLYAKTNGGVKMIAVSTLGVLYIVENGDTINSIADLSGKTIYSTGQGANPEYILNHLLEKNGVTDAKVEFLEQNDELAQKLVSGEASVALVPEPLVSTVTTKNQDLRTALNVNDEWDKIEPDGKLMMGCIVARNAFIEEHPEAIEAFLTEYQASIEKATSDISCLLYTSRCV